MAHVEQPLLLGFLPLIGREAELALATEAIAAGYGVVVAGAPGVGKTRLAAQLVEDGLASTHQVVRIVATRGAASIPLGALGPLVPSGSTPDVLTVNAIAASMHARTDGADRLVLFVDDAHLLDDTSAALVHRLVVDGSALAIVTIRSREAVSDPITALWKDDFCRRLELQALSVEETRELVERVLTGVVDEAVGQRCWALARGNPMFTRELLRGAVETGALGRRRGTWMWRGTFEPAPALVDLVSERLAGLDDNERELLALVAIGEPLPLDIATGLRGAPAVESLARSGLVGTEHDGVRLAHPLYGEIVRSDLNAVSLARLSAELARAHPNPLREPSAEFRRIVWHLDAGTALDPDLLLAASLRAQVHDLHLAARLSRAAVTAGGGSAATLRLADVLMNAGQLEEANDLLADLAAVDVDDRVRISIAAMRATSLLWLQGRAAEAAAVLDKAAAGLHDPALAYELSSNRLHALMFEGRVVDIAAAVDEVLESPLASAETKAGALVAGVSAWLTGGELAVAIERCEAGLAIAARSADAFPVRDFLEFGIAVARLYLGHLDEAEARLHELRRESARSGDGTLRFLFSQGLGRAAMLRGRFGAAVDAFREALALIRMSPDLVAWSLGLLASAQALAGDIAGAEDSIAEARTLTSSAMFAVDRDRADALIAWARGEQTQAVACSLEAADRALERSQFLPALFCAHDAARFGASHDALLRLERIHAFPGDLAPALRLHVEALCGRDADTLSAASERLESLGCWSWAAEAALEAASAFADRALAGRAARAVEQARRMGERANLPVPGLDALRTTASLTRREREIAAMAARGMSDRAVADTLGISVRTVGTHLHRVYTKLGILSRGELAALRIDR